MAAITRFSVAKTAKGYGSAVLGSTVTSTTEAWNTTAYPPAASTTRLAPTS